MKGFFKIQFSLNCGLFLVICKWLGYIYIEVPQDQTDETIQMFVGSNSNIIHSVHEHLNLFSVQSLNALAMALGLKILILEKKSINLGWTQGNIVSGLFIKQ